jgi:hypothetical protein
MGVANVKMEGWQEFGWLRHTSMWSMFRRVKVAFRWAWPTLYMTVCSANVGGGRGPFPCSDNAQCPISKKVLSAKGLRSRSDSLVRKKIMFRQCKIVPHELQTNTPCRLHYLYIFMASIFL